MCILALLGKSISFKQKINSEFIFVVYEGGAQAGRARLVGEGGPLIY